MWNINDIKNKKREVIHRLSNGLDEDNDRLRITLASYVSMLENSGTVKNMRFYDVMDKVTRGHFDLIRPNYRLIVKGAELISMSNYYMDLDYLGFLLELVNNIKGADIWDGEVKDIGSKNFDFSNSDLVKISKLFYGSLNDREIYESAMISLDDDRVLNFSSAYSRGNQSVGGLTFYDYVYNKAYCSTKRGNGLFDLQACNHEIMHSVDFYMKQKLPTENYYGFHEVPTYAIDYLFIDYLEGLGIDREEVWKLRINKDLYLKELAKGVSNKIYSRIVSKKGLSYGYKYTVSDVMEVIDMDIIKDMLEVQSGVMAYGFNKQFESNYEVGIENLKGFMKSTIPMDRRPLFSSFGLGDDELIRLSCEFGEYSRVREGNNSHISL